MSVQPTAPPEVEIVEAGRARLDEIEPLFAAMQEHDAEAAATASAPLALRSTADSWSRRREEFAGWLDSGDAWLLFAEHEGSPVGFAFFRVAQGDRSFETGERVGELEALSVEPQLRRWGIGSLLMEEVEQRLAGLGVDFIGLAFVAGNDDASSFYERWGLAPSQVRCLGRLLPPRH